MLSVVELARAEPRCVCHACAILFRESRSRFCTVPDRVQRLAISDEDWASLGMPVRLSYLVVRDHRCLAFHPSPAGSIEAAVDDEAWAALCARHPALAALLPQVEALLSYRPRSGAGARFVVPIDTCWELNQLVRRTWQGFDGGDAWQAIETFIEGLEGRT